MKALLKVSGLTVDVKTDRGIGRAVDGVDIEVYPGEIVALVGESGSGKSMCARSITKLEPDPNVKITAGTIEFRGTELNSMSETELTKIRGANISMIFQDPSSFLNPVVKIGKQVEEAVDKSLDREARAARVDEVLDLVGLPASLRVKERFPHELSGGMKQRVLIGIALAGNPDLLIADEPTTALDLTIQAQILTLLGELRDKLNMAVLLITHDLGVVAQLCSRAYVMYAGRIVEKGAVRDLFNAPGHPYTAGLLRSSISMQAGGDHTRGISGIVPDLYSRGGGCTFAPRCPFATDLCRTVTPENRGRLGDGMVACHHTERIQADLVGELEELRAENAIAAENAVAAETAIAPQKDVDGVTAERSTAGDGMDAPLLETTALRKVFPLRRQGLFGRRGELVAVADIDFRIDRGESLALVGESGSGKSTIAKLILGLLSPSGGSVKFEGRTIAVTKGSRNKAFRRRVQMVFQNPYSSLNPSKRIGEILRLSYVLHKLKISKSLSDAVASDLEAVGLSAGFVHRYPHQLSGGERQRVAIARALSLKPDLLVADEPASALDMSVRAQIVRLMANRRKADGVSILLITHDLSSAVALTDKVIVLYLGRILESGPTRDTFAHPVHPYTRALVAATPVPDADTPSLTSADLLKGEIPSAARVPSGCVLHPRCPFAQAERCPDEVPQLRPVAREGTKAACHFAEQIMSGELKPGGGNPLRSTTGIVRTVSA